MEEQRARSYRDSSYIRVILTPYTSKYPVSQTLSLVHPQELAQQLYTNENPNPQPFVAKIPRPTEGSALRVHQPPFPHIDAQQVQDIIDEGTAKKVK